MRIGRVNVQGIATIAALGALGGLFLGVGLPVLQEPEAVAPISVVVPESSPAPREREDDADDDAGGDDDRDDRSRSGQVSGDEDDRDEGDD
jgi:hypothetical protein